MLSRLLLVGLALCLAVPASARRIVKMPDEAEKSVPVPSDPPIIGVDSNLNAISINTVKFPVADSAAFWHFLVPEDLNGQSFSVVIAFHNDVANGAACIKTSMGSLVSNQSEPLQQMSYSAEQQVQVNAPATARKQGSETLAVPVTPPLPDASYGSTLEGWPAVLRIRRVTGIGGCNNTGNFHIESVSICYGPGGCAGD